MSDDLTRSTFAFWQGPPTEVSVWLGSTDERGEGAGEWWMQPTPPRALTFEHLQTAWSTLGGGQTQGTWYVAPDVQDAYLNLLMGVVQWPEPPQGWEAWRRARRIL